MEIPELMPHQKEAVYKSTFKPDLYLAFDTGTGKSGTLVSILRQKYINAGRLLNTLVLTPNGVGKKIKSEFIKFSKISPKAIEVLDGPIKRRIRTIENLNGPRIIITNYEALQNVEFVKTVISWKVDILACDEAHNLKSPKSKRAKNLIHISDAAENHFHLSATPDAGNLLDYWMQFRILDGGKTFGKNFFAFRHQYFEDRNAAWQGRANYFPDWQPRPSTYKEFMAKLEGIMLRVKKEDVLKDLPPLAVEQEYVNMGTEQERMYLGLKRDFVAFIKDSLKHQDKAVVAKLAIVKALRMQEIVTGYAKLEDGTIYEFKENPRLERAKELLKQLAPRHKIIVWSVFKHNYAMLRRICEDLGLTYTEIHGDISAKEKYTNQDIFNEDDNCRVLIGNPAAGGVGIDLISSSYSIYYSRGFKLIDDKQSEARNHRKGSEIHDKITRINMICPGTIDELIDKAMIEKASVGETILDNLKAL